MRFDPVLIVALAALTGALWVSAPAPLVCTALLLGCTALRALSNGCVALAVLLWVASAWRAEQQLADFRALHASMRQQLPQAERCFVRLRVTTSPVVRDDEPGYVAQLLSAQCERFVPLDQHLVRVFGGPSELGRGDEVEGIVQLSLVPMMRNFELSDPSVALARKELALRASALDLERIVRGATLSNWIDRARAHVRKRIEATFAPLATGMAKALVLGENDLSREEDSAFKASGLSHLLAVSGTHLVFAVLSLVAGCKALCVRFAALAEVRDTGRWCDGLGALLALLYADFAGGSGSAWRAAWMLTAALGARAIWREVNAPRAVAISILIGWAHDGLAVYDVSFMLSAAATFGLLTLGQRAGAWLEGRSLSRPVRLAAQGFIATGSAMLPCSVLLALMSPEVSLLGIVANVLAAPFGETVALPLCLGHALLSPFPSLEAGTAQVASGALLVVRQLALAVGNSPWFRVDIVHPSSWQMGLAAMGFAAPFLLRQVRQALRLAHVWPCAVAFVVAASGLEWSQRQAGAAESRLRFTALDVGQGDAALIDLPNGELMLIDAGGVVGASADPGARVVVPVLRARRRAHIDIVVLSHPHPDHFGGLEAVLQRVSVGELWDTGQGEREGAGPAYRQLLATARARGIPLRRPSELCGRHERGGATLEVLGPCPDFEPGDNPNDNSLVLRISFGTRAILLTGDAELAQERRLLLRAPDALRADLLKVGHHGSRTSSSIEFLHQVAPTVATISCGQGNRFGHPHTPALTALQSSGAEVYRTDVSGAVRWQTDGHGVRLTTFQDCCLGFHF